MSLTTQEQEDQADEELSKKQALEATFLPLLLKIFDRMANELHSNYLSNGLAISAYTFIDEFKSYFEDLYTRTSNAFKSSLDNQLDEDNEIVKSILQAANGSPLGPKTAQDVIDQLDSQVEPILVQENDNNSTAASIFVTNTNQNNIDTAISFGIAAQIINRLTRIETANLIKNKFLSLINQRIGTIVATSVQQSAEGTKFAIIDKYNSMARTISGKTSNVEKVWLTRMDDKVRLSHREANFQSVPTNIPFTVQNQSLMFPGDTSLGATISNVANCRCVMVPNIL